MAIRYYTTDSDSLIYYAATNAQGDVLGLYGGSGTLYVTYEYDSWGNLISMTDNTDIGIGSINPIRYRGYYFDSETGLYYLQSRYYDPQVGRFINADDTSLVTATPSALTDKNLYAYCDNNPISRMDDSGCFWKELKSFGETCIKAAAAAVCVVAAVVVMTGAIAFTVGSGGLGAVAIPAAMVMAAECVGAASLALASIGVASCVASEIGSNIQYAENDFASDSTYITDKVRVDYEVYGNGNAHIHIKNSKHHIYEQKNGEKIFYRLTNPVKKIIQSSDINRAVKKAIHYVVELTK